MKTIILKIEPNKEDTNVISGMLAKAVSATLAKIKQMESAVADIRDPKTGERATVTWEIVDDEVRVIVKGSDFVKAEADRRISSLPGQRLL